MPQSAEEVYERVVAQVGADGRLPMPGSARWDIFPWEVVDGAMAPKVLRGVEDEPTRFGDPDDDRGCPQCVVDQELVVWEDETWALTHRGAPSGLPVVLMLTPKEHEDFGEIDDETASQLGRITNRLVRIIENLPHIGRVHVNRWGDGGSHLHVWFFARTARLAGVLGSPASEWDAVLPPTPEVVWREDLSTIAEKLANWGGEARV